MGPTALLPLRGKAWWGFFRRLRPGLNPRTWVPKASTLPLDHRSRKVPGWLGMVWQAQKILWWSVFYYQPDLITLEFLSIPTDKNLKYWGGVNVGDLARKLRSCGHILVWRTHSCMSFKYFRYTLCKPSVRTSQTTQFVPLNLRTVVPVCVIRSQMCIMKVTHTQHKFLYSFCRQHISALFWAIIRRFIRTLIQKVKTALGWRSPFYIKIYYWYMYLCQGFLTTICLEVYIHACVCVCV